ncbi:MAG: inorganic phosphate transporter [Bacteroidales bacterium]|jgi:phosphate/sulfate permease|nr:inorganic phosphate transporter [Bacteroidales bacterium]
MEIYYVIIVGILFLLAISDLVVGVANDAANFIGSAVGSKAATFKVILAVASLGVVVGAMSANGMMEVARSGIFNPTMFYFNEIMLIFLTAMLADIILLDLFNTYGFPTSTTISLIFELMGAAVAITVMKIVNTADLTMADLGTFLNTSRIVTIVSSIFASVIVGFIAAAVIQYFVRLSFTFKLHKTQKYFGAIWGGICVTMILYFIVFKGMKDFLRDGYPELFTYLTANQGFLMIASFIIIAVLLQSLYWLFRVNALKFIVLMGTFALAMAFAGNDLVNFIGVPVAGLNSFQLYQEAGAPDPGTFQMLGMSGRAEAPKIILFASGLVMILALWFSKKARNVTKMTVDLSRQDTGIERFGSTPLSRSIVKMFTGLDEWLTKVIPKKLNRKISRRFRPSKKAEELQQGAAFDMLRASVNLMVASALIAFATSLRLPLSTTYITFMVAMGSSLSDGAWGRDSAVYRVTGMFSVIGGWFFTAIAASSIAFSVGMILYFGGPFGIAGMLILVAFLMWHTSKIHKRREKSAAKVEKSFIVSKDEAENIHKIASDTLCTSLQKMETMYSETIDALSKESIRKLEAVRRDLSDIRDETKLMKNNLNLTIQAFNDKQLENMHYYVQAVNYLREVSFALKSFIEVSFAHTNNKHKPLVSEQQAELAELNQRVVTFLGMVKHHIATENFQTVEESLAYEQDIVQYIESINKNQMKRVKNGYCGTKNSLLYSAILTNSRNLLLFTSLLLKAQRDFLRSSE